MRLSGLFARFARKDAATPAEAAPATDDVFARRLQMMIAPQPRRRAVKRVPVFRNRPTPLAV
jgi:hypothetical protein